MDKFPQINIQLIRLPQIILHCNETLQRRRKRQKIDIHSYLENKPTESLHQFGNVFNEVVAKCNFGNQTKSGARHFCFKHVK